MRYSITIDSTPSIKDGETQRVTPLRSHSALFVTLTSIVGTLPREEVLSLTWPTVDLETGRNRLRVALSSFKKSHPGLITVQGNEIGIGPDVEGGLLTARGLLDEIALSVSDSQECDAIEALLSYTTPIVPFLSPDHYDWWTALCEHAIRYLRIAPNFRLHDEVLDHIRPFFCILTTDSSGAVACLDFAKRSGMASRLLRELRPLFPPHVLESKDVGEALRALAREPDRGNQKLDRDERDLILELFESALNTDPHVARQLLVAPPSLALSGKYPRAMHQVLERATAEEPAEIDDAWLRCRARLMGLKAWLGDADGVLKLAPRMLEQASGKLGILRPVWNTIAIAHSLRREWPEAEAALQKTIETATEEQNQMGVLAARGNQAFFAMQRIEFDESYAQYDRIHAEFKEMGTPHAEFELSIGLGHQAFIPVFRQDWVSAAEHMETAIQARQKLGSEIQMGLLQICLAACHMNLGKTKRVLQLTRMGLRDSFLSESERTIENALEFAAMTLATAGDPELAAEVVQFVGKRRDRLHHPRSAAESAWCNPLAQVQTTNSIGKEPEMTLALVGRLLLRRLSELLNQSQGR